MDIQTESSRESSAVEILRAWPTTRSATDSSGARRRQHRRVRVDESVLLGRRRRARGRYQLASACVAKCRTKARRRLNQVHGNDVHAATRDTARARPDGDGLVTAEPGVMLAIFTADCVPILMVDAKRRVAGALHAGWRGVIAGIADAGVHAMVALGARPPKSAPRWARRSANAVSKWTPNLASDSPRVDGARTHITRAVPARPSSICAPSSRDQLERAGLPPRISPASDHVRDAPPIVFSRAAPPADKSPACN